MKKTLLFAPLAVLLFSCEKEKDEVVESNFTYTNLNNVAITSNNHLEFDLNNDGVKDFHATTVLVDQNDADRLQFKINTKQGNKVLLQNGQIPKVMESGDSIKKVGHTPYEWTSQYGALIVERVMPVDVAQSRWEGAWKDKRNKYLPIQIVKDGKTYNGWIQVSFSDTTPFKIVLHDAAVSKTPDVGIKAGQK